MNERFICIKVDREERPDLDHIYQTAHQVMNQSGGGWPLTVFLAPDTQRPFFSGTYFRRSNGTACLHSAPCWRSRRVPFDAHRRVREHGDKLVGVLGELQPRRIAATRRLRGRHWRGEGHAAARVRRPLRRLRRGAEI